MADYIIPFGADAAPYLKGLEAMDTGTDKFVQKTEDAQNKIRQAYDKGATSSAKAADGAKKAGAAFISSSEQAKILVAQMDKLAKAEALLFAEKDQNKIKLYTNQIANLKANIDALSASQKKASDGAGDVVKGLGKAEEAAGGLSAAAGAVSKGFGFIRQAAYLLPGIGIAGIFNLIGEGVIALAKQLIVAGDGFNEIANKVKVLTDVSQDAHKHAGEQLTDAKYLYQATQNLALSDDERLKAVKALQSEFPEFFGNIKTETVLNGGAKDAYDELTKSIIANANAVAAKDKIDQIAAQRLDILFQKQKIRNANANENAAARPTSYGGAGGTSTTLSVAEIKKANDERAAAALKEQDILDQRLKNQEDFLVQFAGGAKAITKVVEDQNQAGINSDAAAAARAEKANEARLKREAAAAEKLRKQREAELKAYNDLQAKFAAQLDSLSATAIPDTENKEIAASNARFERIKADAQREVNEAKVTADQRAQLQIEANKVIAEADQAEIQARLDIQKKYNDKRLKLEQDAQKALDEISGTKQGADIARIEQHYKDLADTIAKGGLLTDAAQAAIDQARQREIDDVNIKYGEDQIKKQTDLNVKKVQVDEQFVGKGAAVEKAKQLAILKAQLDGAQQQLDLLLKNHKAIDSAEVLNAQQTVNNLKAAIKNTQSNNGKGQSLFEFLGISTDGQKDLLMYAKAASEAGKITSDFFGALADSLNQQIEAKKALVDQDNKELDDLATRLDKEKDLRDQGLANNVDTLQAELDAKTAQRDADLKNQQEVQAKQNALKKAQIVADSIAQVSNLITAASEIFSAFSEIPFVGVPLAIAAIGLMFGAFALAKVNAFNAVGSSQSLGEGGYVDGKPHSQGGKKYRAMDGSGRVVELEGGEHVTNKRSTKKYSSLLDAINSDDLGGMTEDALREMLAGLGIGMSASSPREVVKVVRERNTYRQEIATSGQPGHDISADVKTISENVSFLATREKERPERWADDKYFYTKTGNTTTRIKR
jgi:hypothetical protein